MLQFRGPQVIERDWRPGFTIDLQQKDLRLVLVHVGIVRDAEAPLVAALVGLAEGPLGADHLGVEQPEAVHEGGVLAVSVEDAEVAVFAAREPLGEVAHDILVDDLVAQTQGADHVHGLLSVHHLLAEGSVLGHHLFFRVAEQGEWNVVFRDELLVRGFAVRRNTQNDDVFFLEFTHQVTESLGFLGSPGCVVLGVKKQDDIFALEVFQGHLVAVLIRQCECRCGLAFLNCHGNSFLLRYCAAMGVEVSK
mgnify:CR=1 FL=1